MVRRTTRSTQSQSSAASHLYKTQMQNALDLLGTMQRKSTGQSTNTKTRKLVKVQATSSKSEAKLKKTPAAKTKKKA